MNEIAMQLTSLGQTEAALKIQTQIEDSTASETLQQITQECQFQLGSPHEVQRFYCDVYGTKVWIHQIDEALD